MGSDPAIQILEAGTGHGGLTLHLARAIHAANAGISPLPRKEGHASRTDQSKSPTAIWRYAKTLTVGSLSRIFGSGNGSKVTKARDPWRRAVVHTIDVSSKYSELATKTVSGFRRGMYLRDIEFYVSSVSEWIDQQMQSRSQRPFLSHAILDLPSSHSYIEGTANALQVDGKLLVFNPSITQINSVVELVKSKRLPLQLEKVVETGPAMTGGRPWNVRFLKPRALIKGVDDQKTPDTGTADPPVIDDEGRNRSNKAKKEDNLDDDDDDDDEGWEMVCRPKPGDRISGGGFVALWSKNRTRNKY